MVGKQFLAGESHPPRCAAGALRLPPSRRATPRNPRSITVARERALFSELFFRLRGGAGSGLTRRGRGATCKDDFYLIVLLSR
jgi:hypothetical protein